MSIAFKYIIYQTYIQLSECNKSLIVSERATVPVEFHKLLIQAVRPEHLNTQTSSGPALLEHLELLHQQEETFQHRLDSDRILVRSGGV